MSSAVPSIMLMRHAEEPDGDASPSLSPRGWQRAGALVRWLAPLGLPGPSGPLAAPPAPLATPRRIVAAARSDAHPSTRAHDTVAPLAQALQLEVEQPFDSDADTRRTAAWLRSLDAAVLVCWRHDALPALARALLPPDRASAVPAVWPEERFDLVWVLQPRSDGWMLSQVPQLLLAGDRSHGIVRRVARTLR